MKCPYSSCLHTFSHPHPDFLFVLVKNMFYSSCTKRSQVCLHCQVDRATEDHSVSKGQQKYKEQYDRKHCHPGAYQVGAKVLRRDFTRRNRKGGNMDFKVAWAVHNHQVSWKMGA